MSVKHYTEDMITDEMFNGFEEFCNSQNCEHCQYKEYEPEGDCRDKWIEDNFEVKQIENKTNDDTVNHPSYYQGKIEVIDFIEDKDLGFCLGNAIKYISRAGKKDPDKEIEDLKKAEWYIERYIKKIERGK